MKIKDFKKQIKEENYDIPNVLEKIKPIADEKEFAVLYRSEHKMKFIFRSIQTACLVIICGIIVVSAGMNNFHTKGEAKLPEDNMLGENQEAGGMVGEASNGAQNISSEEMKIFDYYVSINEAKTSENQELDGASYQTYGITEISGDCGNDGTPSCLVLNQKGTVRYVITYNQFVYLQEYIASHANESAVKICNDIAKEFNISSDYYYAISDAYNYIIYIK